MVSDPSCWLRQIGQPGGRVRLVCFPPSGSAPGAFASWPRQLGPQVEVWAVLLPGREMRIAEEPLTRIPELTRAVSAAIADLVQPPVAFFGHSMGALLAYEVARSLLDGGMAPVRHLAVAAYPAPHLSLASRGLHRLDDAALLRSVATLGGMPPGVLLSHHHALLELLLPAIRADLEACETYQHATGPPLPCPITAYAGTADDLVPSWSMRQWDRYATGGFAFRAIDGGHFFPVSHQDELLGDLAHLLLGKGPAIYAPGH